LPEYLALNRYVFVTNVGEAKRILREGGFILSYKNVKNGKYPLKLANEIKKSTLIEKF